MNTAAAGSRFTELRPFFFIKVACVALACQRTKESLRAATSEDLFFSFFFGGSGGGLEMIQKVPVKARELRSLSDRPPNCTPSTTFHFALWNVVIYL